MGRVELAIDEKTSIAVKVSFLDESKALTFPEVATYRLDDENGENIIPETMIEPTERATIEIPRTANAILDRANRTERRVLTIDYTYGAGTKGARTPFVYEIRRLEF